jgi:arabinofuranosyltransferase
MGAMTTDQPPRVPPAVVWLYLALALLLLVILRHAWLCDDAYVTFRTVRNVVAGAGPRWNLHERVQAYTHPLWMLLLCPLYALRHDVYLVAIGLSLALSLAAAWMVAFRLAGPPVAGVLALAALLSSKSFVDFSTSGLENPLSYLLYTAFLMAATGPRGRSLGRLALLAALMALNRLDTLLLALPALVERTVVERRDRRALLGALAGFAPLIGWELFSLGYYGFLFPNTAYAKLGGGIARARLAEQGLGYYLSQVGHDPITLLVITAGVAAPFIARERRLYALSVGLVLYLGYIVFIGGDFMAGRFFSVPLLGAAVLLARCAPALLGPGGTASPIPAAALAALALVITPRPTLTSNANYSNALPPAQGDWDARGVGDERAYWYPSTGMLRLSRTTDAPMDDRPARGRALPPGGVAALGMIGAIGFFAPPDTIVVDSHGLTDPLVARLPLADPTSWRIGHPERTIPAGYIETLQRKQNLLRDPAIATLYDRLRVVTAGPLWRAQRWKEILRFAIGR